MSRNNDTEHKMDNGVFKKGTHKRLRDAAQINLSRIAERDETQKLFKISADTIDERNIFDKYDDSRENSFEKEKEEKSKHAEKDKKNKVNKTKNERVIEDLGKRKVYHGYEPECEKLAEEEIKTTKVSEKRHMDRVNKLEGNKFRVECEKSINKKSSAIELKLDLTKFRSETDSSDEMDIKQNDGKRNKSDGDSPINRDDLFFPGLKHTCKHGNINYTPRKGDTLYQSSSPGQKSDKIPRKCILCDINGASVRNKAVQTDSDKLLSELIYPYEFYDRFSRANIRQNEEKTKEVIPICQPVNVVQKPTTPKRMTPLIPVPASTPEISDKESMKESPLEAPKHSPVDTGEVEKEVRKEKKEKRVQYLYEPRENLKTEFHGDCGNTMNALVVTEHAEGHKRTLPGMKGYFQQQQKDAKSLQKAVKQSEYTINSLGIQFTIPEYNTSLRSRREPVATPRPPTQQTLYSPRFNEQYLPLSRPPTFRQSPRQTLLTSTPRDMFTPVQQPTAPVPTVEDIVKSFDTRRSRLSEPFSVKTSGETTSSSRKEKLLITSEEDLKRRSQKAMPPIPTGVRQGHRRATLISGPITVGGFTL